MACRSFPVPDRREEAVGSVGVRKRTPERSGAAEFDVRLFKFFGDGFVLYARQSASGVDQPLAGERGGGFEQRALGGRKCGIGLQPPAQVGTAAESAELGA